MFDLSYLNFILNIVVMVLKDIREMEFMMDLLLKLDCLLVIRYLRGSSYYLDKGEYGEIVLGKYEVLDDG